MIKSMLGYEDLLLHQLSIFKIVIFDDCISDPVNLFRLVYSIVLHCIVLSWKEQSID